MAVSLKKPQKADLSNSDSPSIREYTPVHLLDEEETIIKRPRQPPIQPQHIEDDSAEVLSGEKRLEAARKNLKDFLRKYQYPFLISISVACLIVLVVLLIRTFSPAVHTSVENVSNTTVLSETSIYSASVESVPIENASVNEDYSFVSYFNVFLETFKELIWHPAVLIMLGTTFLLLAIRLVKRIMRY